MYFSAFFPLSELPVINEISPRTERCIIFLHCYTQKTKPKSEWREKETRLG